MLFSVRVVRHRGRILPAHELANQPPRLGDLIIEAVHDAEMRRYVTTVVSSLRPLGPAIAELRHIPCLQRRLGEGLLEHANCRTMMALAPREDSGPEPRVPV